MTLTARTRELETCGIRTLHQPRAGLTRATLYVGVGWADETFATRGVTHTIEHLAMSAVPRRKYEMNAAVVALRTGFWANGRPDQVAEFLNAVVRGLTDLPLDRLEREVGVLRAETGAGAARGPLECALKSRYGNQGLGLGFFGGLGPAATDPDVVRAHLARWFVRDNTVLVVSGDLPEGLELVLPDGEVPQRTFHETGRPGAVGSDVADPVLSFVARDAPETLLLLRSMAHRLEDTLRHERGVVYGLYPDVVRLPGTGRVLAAIGAQTAPDAEREVAAEMVAELRRRAEHGITPEELAEDLEWWDAAAADPDCALADLESDADRLLSGQPVVPDEEARARTAALGAEDVAAAAREALGTAVLNVPRGMDTDDVLPDGAGCATARELTVPPLRRRLFRPAAPKGAALGLRDGVVQYRDEDGDVHEVRLEECVGLGRDGGVRLLIGARGCFIWVDPRAFRGTEALVRQIDAAVPAELTFELADAIL